MNKDTYDLDAQEDEKAKALAAQQRRAAQEVSDFKALMELPEFRRFLWGLIERCGVFTNSFTGNSHTFFNEGKRLVGTTYWGLLQELTPEKYPVMVREQKNDD